MKPHCKDFARLDALWRRYYRADLRDAWPAALRVHRLIRAIAPRLVTPTKMLARLRRRMAAAR